MLVQVVKEERGTKGAALTTYLSLAGRYCVLMPNTARGGGISRKITSADDRKKLREIAEELDVPEGMGVILRTAGAARTKAEVKRDFEYLLRLWETGARPHAEIDRADAGLRGRLARQALDPRPLHQGHRGDRRRRRDRLPRRQGIHAHAHAEPCEEREALRRTQQPIFTRYGIESQLDAMFSPTVQLRSGGYIVINQTEALVSIDVNSGRSTREHHIEDTALKTNCEAAEEVARQLRLRDLAGLIVIDFIDMDEKRNNRTVERRMKDALRNDRARIQVGRISHFGLLEMSRQRIRTSVLESSTEKCPHCGGTGHMRSVSSVALQLLRSIEETLLKGATHNQIVRTRPEIALYVLNHKRAHLHGAGAALPHFDRRQLPTRRSAASPASAIDRGEQVMTAEQAKAIAAQALAAAPPQLIEEEEPDDIEEDVEETVPERGEVRRARRRYGACRPAARSAGDERARRRPAPPAARPRPRRRTPRRARRRRVRRLASGPGEAAPGEMPVQREQPDDGSTPAKPAKAASRRSRTAIRTATASAGAAGAAAAAAAATAAAATAMAHRSTATVATEPRSDFHGGDVSRPEHRPATTRGHAHSAPQHEPDTRLRPSRLRPRRAGAAPPPAPAPDRAAGAAPPLDGARAGAGVRRQRAGADPRAAAAARAGAGGDLGRPTTPSKPRRPAGGPSACWATEANAESRARCRAAGSIATRRRRSIAMPRRASRATWRCASTPRACSAAIPSWCCTAAATPRSRRAMPTSPARRPRCSASRAPARTWRRSSPPGCRRCGSTPLRKLRARDDVADEEMVRVQRANLIDPAAPNPSVETLLHAFLPHKFVDHTHATAVLSLVDQPDGERALRARSMAAAWASCPTSCRASASPRRRPRCSTPIRRSKA